MLEQNIVQSEVWFRVLFLLMNKDTKWLLFDCYEDEFGFVAGKEIEWYTESRPIGYDNIGDFLDARKAPKHRKHIAELLKKYGCESIENFLKLTHALSLNDTFWVKQPESTLSWNDVSLYRNEFDELVSNAAFDGVISSTTLSSTSQNSERMVHMQNAGSEKTARFISTKAAVTPMKSNHCLNFSPRR